MLYFTLSLILSLALSGAVLAGLIKCLQVNWSRKNRYPISFLAPVLLTVVFTLLTLYLTVPRILDTVNMVSKTYSIEEISVVDGNIGWSTLNDGRRIFFFNQWRFHPEVGKTYRISYVPRSLFVVDFAEVADIPEGQP